MKSKEIIPAVEQFGLFGKQETKSAADYDMIDMGVYRKHPPKDLRMFVLKQNIQKPCEEEKPIATLNT